jgi:hypothetical protein
MLKQSVVVDFVNAFYRVKVMCRQATVRADKGNSADGIGHILVSPDGHISEHIDIPPADAQSRRFGVYAPSHAGIERLTWCLVQLEDWANRYAPDLIETNADMERPL